MWYTVNVCHCRINTGEMRTLLGQIIDYRLGGNATIGKQNVIWGGGVC